MKKIQGFDVQNARNGAVIAFAKAIIVFLGASQWFIQKYKNIYDALVAAYDEMVKVSSRHRAHLLTPEISAADRRRDSVITAMMGIIAMMLTDADPAKQEAAKRLSIIKKSFGGMTSMPYNVETGTIIGFLRDLRNYHAADITLLGLEQYVADLEAANNAFIALMDERTEDVAPFQKGELVEAKRTVVKNYRIVEQALNVTHRIATDTGDNEAAKASGDLIDLINAEIDQQKRSMRSKGKAEDEEFEEEDWDEIEGEEVDSETEEEVETGSEEE